MPPFVVSGVGVSHILRQHNQTGPRCNVRASPRTAVFITEFFFNFHLAALLLLLRSRPSTRAPPPVPSGRSGPTASVHNLTLKYKLSKVNVQFVYSRLIMIKPWRAVSPIQQSSAPAISEKGNGARSSSYFRVANLLVYITFVDIKVPSTGQIQQKMAYQVVSHLYFKSFSSALYENRSADKD